MTPWDQARGGKPRPNHQRYLSVLRQMTPQQRLATAFELTEHARDIPRRTQDSLS